MSDDFKGFYRLSRQERLRRIQANFLLSDQEVLALSGENSLTPDIAENLIENVIGCFQLPLGVATHFQIDGKDHLIPMAVEETSIIAAASSTAKWVKENGYISTYAKGRLIIGQIQIPHLKNIENARKALHSEKKWLIDRANQIVPGLVSRGGGIRDIVIRECDRVSEDGKMLVLHLLCDPCDAMGANLINQVCEGLKGAVEKITGETVGLCILSNLVDGKRTVAEVVVRNVGAEMGEKIEEASIFAESDPYRAATHNKGILNGIDPVLIATGNDWRAVEAGIHAFAARSGTYQPVATWRFDGRELRGVIDVPMAVGVVGGVTKIHPAAKVALKILGVTDAESLARIAVAVGIVQNLGALRALSTVGIVKGHMELHASNLAIAAGATASEIEPLRSRLTEVLKTERSINLSRARILLDEQRAQGTLA